MQGSISVAAAAECSLNGATGCSRLWQRHRSFAEKFRPRMISACLGLSLVRARSIVLFSYPNVFVSYYPDTDSNLPSSPGVPDQRVLTLLLFQSAILEPLCISTDVLAFQSESGQ